MWITLDKASELILSGKATYNGTTHTDKFGYAAIIIRHDESAIDHVQDVGPRDMFELTAANNGYRLQFSDHGAGRTSVQVFDRHDRLVRDYNQDGNWDWGSLALDECHA